jgi:predicted dienelactone hydrolase
MRKQFVALFVIFLFCPVVLAQRPAGNWAGSISASDFTAAIGLNFDESKIIVRFGGRELTGSITEFGIDNGTMRFIAALRPSARFAGTISGDVLGGTFEYVRDETKDSDRGTWSVRKVESLTFTAATAETPANIVPTLPKPTGRYAIGRRFFYWTDESRPETITKDPDDKRRIFVQLWYPAKSSSKVAADYYPGIAELKPKDADYYQKIATHTTENPKPIRAKSGLPLLVFSPGLGATPFGYTAIIEELVSRGFVVAAINHPFDSGDFKFIDGSAIRFATESWERPTSAEWTGDQRKRFFDERRLGWAADVSFVLDRLINNKLAMKLVDAKRIGMFGHSYGGQAASIVCASDPRFKACANLDGMAQGEVVLPGAQGFYQKQPFLFLTKSDEVTDSELLMMNMSRSDYRAIERRRLIERWRPSFRIRMSEIESGSYLATYQGIRHNSFGDSLVLNGNSDPRLFADRLRIADAINDVLIAFFEKTLQNRTNSPLDTKSNFPEELTVEFLRKSK